MHGSARQQCGVTQHFGRKKKSNFILLKAKTLNHSSTEKCVKNGQFDLATAAISLPLFFIANFTGVDEFRGTQIFVVNPKKRAWREQSMANWICLAWHGIGHGTPSAKTRKPGSAAGRRLPLSRVCAMLPEIGFLLCGNLLLKAKAKTLLNTTPSRHFCLEWQMPSFPSKKAHKSKNSLSK